MARRNSLKSEWQFEPEIEPGNHSLLIDAITLPASQPRRYFDPQKLQQLTESIRQHGILEPLLVRPIAQAGLYELVAGERRFRAAKEAGLDAVPVTIRDLSDEESLQLALVENLQREDLNPLEEAEGILQLLGIRLEISPDNVPALLYRMRNEAIGTVNQNVLISSEAMIVQAVFSELATITWESFATTRLPLLHLPQEVIDALRSGKLAYTKAQVIARVKDPEQRSELLEATVSQGLSLTQVKEQIAGLKAVVTATNERPLLKTQIDDVLRLAKRSKVWEDPKKQKKLEKLLTDLRALVSDSD
jgi:ParB family transcriptional regulator, chromosome partitioning protein